MENSKISKIKMSNWQWNAGFDYGSTKNLNLKKLLWEWQAHFDEQLDAFVWKETNMKKIVSVGIKSGWIGEDWNMATDNGNGDRNAMLGCDRKLGWKIDLYF